MSFLILQSNLIIFIILAVMVIIILDVIIMIIIVTLLIIMIVTIIIYCNGYSAYGVNNYGFDVNNNNKS